ncbi:hypothetical protein PTKIN_Ptkin09bG0142300 [Pterospermum kingtungense]
MESRRRRGFTTPGSNIWPEELVFDKQIDTGSIRKSCRLRWCTSFPLWLNTDPSLLKKMIS